MKKRLKKGQITKARCLTKDGVNRGWVMQKSNINTLLNAVISDYLVIGPKPSGHGDYLFSYIHNVDELSLDYVTTTNTTKEFFFPRQETLFDFKKAKRVEITSNAKQHPDKELVLFGVRSCDVRAINFQDFFFSRDLKDNYYFSRRNNSILVSFACDKPRHNRCFCNSVSSGPFLQNNEGFDIQLVDLGLLFLIECNSTKGHALLKRYKHLFDKSVDSNIAERYKLQEESLKKFSSQYNLKKVNKRLSEENFMQLWQELGLRCQNCAGCEFICPTCFCFHMYDELSDSGQDKRSRAWDSCTFSGFSKMAGGVNPLGERFQRISRRFYCKLFNTFKWSGMFGCVGCGRCSFVCPVNLDMESFIFFLSKSKNNKKYLPLLKEL